MAHRSGRTGPDSAGRYFGDPPRRDALPVSTTREKWPRGNGVWINYIAPDSAPSLLSGEGPCAASGFWLAGRLARSGPPVTVRGADLARTSTRCCAAHDRDSLYCLLYTSTSPRDGLLSRMPSSA